MFKLLLVAVVGSAVFISSSDATCRFTDKMTPVNVNMDLLASKRLIIIYRTVNNFGKSLDHSYIDMTKTGQNKYRAINTFVKKDNSTVLRNYTVVYENGIMYETYDYKYDDGTNYKAKSYILGQSTEGAILFYRCSSAAYPEDFRFIVISEGKTLSNKSLDQLMSIDKSFNFNRDLFKLPNNYYGL